MSNASTADSDSMSKTETKSASTHTNKPQTTIKSQPKSNPTPNSKPESLNSKSEFETDDLIPLPDSEIPN